MIELRPYGGRLEEYFLTCSGGVRVPLVVLELGQSVPFELQNVYLVADSAAVERGRHEREPF